MNNKKTLFLTDVETGIESILLQRVNVEPENMLILQSYGSSISHPYGDVMRSIIIAIYEDNVEEIFVVGTKGKNNISDRYQNLLSSENMKDKLKTVDYLFKNCKPEFYGDSLRDWLEVGEDAAESINKSVEIIRQHPLVPPNVKVHGFLVNKKGEMATVNQ